MGFGVVLAHYNEETQTFEIIRVISGRWSSAELNYTMPAKEITVLLKASKRFYYEMFGRDVHLLCNGTTSQDPRIRNNRQAAGLLVQGAPRARRSQPRA